jgi:repressor LexA
MKLTEIQNAILTLIAERIAAEGMPPSQTEIARAFGFKSVRAAQYHLEALAAAGAIERIPGRARGIRVLRTPALPQQEIAFADAQRQGPQQQDPQQQGPRQSSGDDNALRVPLLGRVAAGMPIGADIGSDDDYVLLDRVLFAPAPDYVLRVKGDSMRDEGIFDGDLIGVHRTREARSGQIVVARIDDEITVKLLKIGKDAIRLLPRNPDYEPIVVKPDDDFAIEGLYCGLVRPNR